MYYKLNSLLLLITICFITGCLYPVPSPIPTIHTELSGIVIDAVWIKESGAEVPVDMILLDDVSFDKIHHADATVLSDVPKLAVVVINQNGDLQPRKRMLETGRRVSVEGLWTRPRTQYDLQSSDKSLYYELSPGQSVILVATVVIVED